MKSSKNTLKFNTNTIVELDSSKMRTINGGTSDALPISSCICPIIFKTLTINN